MRERDIELYLVRQCRKRGIYCRKWTSPGNRGVPDRIVLHDGTWYALELKSPTGSLTKLQQVEIETIRKHGGYCTVLNSKESVDAFLARLV
jgi:hypothetical protein